MNRKMNKIIWLLVSTFSMGYAQDVAIVDNLTTTTPYYSATIADYTLLSNQDFTLSGGRMQVSELRCQLQNDGSSNNFLLSVVCQQRAFKEIGVGRINEMIVFANMKARNTLNYTQKYQTDEIKMIYNPILKCWSLTNLFTAEDVDGKIKSNLLALEFDSCGKFMVMKRVL